jgi:Tol biopolymer transport system component
VRSTAIGTALAALLVALPASAKQAPVPVPRGDFLVCEGAGRLLVLSASGGTIGTTRATTGPNCATGLALSADRRTAYFGVLTGEGTPPALEQVDLATGRTRRLASGLDPAVSPDGSRLAFIATAESPGGGFYVPTGLELLDLSTGASRVLAAPTPPPGAHKVYLPEGPLSWSPDGTKVAVFAGDRIRIVDVAIAHDLASQPTVPGDVPDHPISKRIYPPPPTGTSTVAPPPGVTVVTVAPPPAPTTATSRAPAYLDANMLVALYDCCIGLSHLVAFDLRTGKHTAFATLYGPPVNVTRIGAGRLLVLTAANLLVVATRGHAEQLATGISAATG